MRFLLGDPPDRISRITSDSLGRYRLQSIPRGEHLVVTRAVGFRPDSALTVFDGDEALINDVRLKVQLNTLPTVAVREASTPVVRGKMAAYEERKAAHIGHFIDRELLAKDENRKLSDILAVQRSGSRDPSRRRIEGVGARSGRTTSSAKCAMCRVSKTEMLDGMDIAAGAPLACYLDVYLDGAQIYDSSARKMPLFNLNSIGPAEIQAVEVYTSAAQIPAQYNKTSGELRRYADLDAHRWSLGTLLGAVARTRRSSMTETPGRPWPPGGFVVSVPRYRVPVPARSISPLPIHPPRSRSRRGSS